MKNILRTAVERRKQYLIHKLIHLGAYERKDCHLLNRNLTDLEEEYKYMMEQEKGEIGRRLT
ncbi:Fur-regulated basic protein FbpA [Bacillus songklensis]|uniref:Fur-regulated basic protein FbpA n=1 Tax=Bacillus songklensis TaxID=1069116 RepID=A0ABV8B2U7_9BACI